MVQKKWGMSVLKTDTSVRGSVRSFFSGTKNEEGVYDDVSIDSEASSASFVQKMKNPFAKKKKEALLLGDPTDDSLSEETSETAEYEPSTDYVDDNSDSEYQSDAEHAKERRRSRLKTRRGIGRTLEQEPACNFGDNISIDESYADTTFEQQPAGRQPPQRRAPPRTASRQEHRRAPPGGRRFPPKNKSYEEGPRSRGMKKCPPPRAKSFDTCPAETEQFLADHRQGPGRPKRFPPKTKSASSAGPSRPGDSPASNRPNRRPSRKFSGNCRESSPPRRGSAGSDRHGTPMRDRGIDDPKPGASPQKALCRHGEVLGQCCYEQTQESAPLFSLDFGSAAPTEGGPAKFTTRQDTGDGFSDNVTDTDPSQINVFYGDMELEDGAGRRRRRSISLQRRSTNGASRRSSLEEQVRMLHPENHQHPDIKKERRRRSNQKDEQARRRSSGSTSEQRRSSGSHREGSSRRGGRTIPLNEAGGEGHGSRRGSRTVTSSEPGGDVRGSRRGGRTIPLNEAGGEGHGSRRGSRTVTSSEPGGDVRGSRRGGRTIPSGEPVGESRPSRSRSINNLSGDSESSSRRERSVSTAGHRRRRSNPNLLGDPLAGSNHRSRDRSLSMDRRKRQPVPQSLLEASGSSHGDARRGVQRNKSGDSQRRERSVSTTRCNRPTPAQPSLLDSASDKSNSKKQAQDDESDSDSSGDYTNRSPKKPQKLDSDPAPNRGRSSSVRPSKRAEGQYRPAGQPRKLGEAAPPDRSVSRTRRPQPPSRSVSRSRQRSVSRSRSGEGADIGEFLQRTSVEKSDQRPMASDAISTNTGSTGTSSAGGVGYATPAWMWKANTMNMAEVPSPYEEQVDRAENES